MTDGVEIALAALAARWVCPACDSASSDPRDRSNGYCGRCRWWTGDPALAWARPDLFLAHGKVPPGEPGAIRGLTADQVIVDEAPDDV